MQNPDVRGVVRRFANRVPKEQLTQALAYFDHAQTRPAFVTGHSLGGALAQVVAQRRGVPAIAFNAPFMGDLAGVAPTTSPNIVQVNTHRDPLSLATGAAGNLPHGRVITIDIPPFHPGPRLATVPRWERIVAPGVALLAASENQVKYHRELLAYLGDAMLYYHSMKNLLRQLRTMPRFAVELRPDLNNI